MSVCCMYVLCFIECIYLLDGWLMVASHVLYMLSVARSVRPTKFLQMTYKLASYITGQMAQSIRSAVRKNKD